MKWFVSLIIIAVGCLMVIKTQWIYEFTGPIDWAEQHGGTHAFIKLLGVALILGTFLGVTGVLGNWLTGFFGGLGR